MLNRFDDPWQPFCKEISRLCTTYFLKDLKGLEQTRFDLKFMSPILASTSFSLKAGAHVGGFLKFIIRKMEIEIGSAFVRSQLRVAVKDYFVCADGHMQTDQKVVDLGPISKVPQGASILDFVQREWFYEKPLVGGGSCFFCKKLICNQKRKISKMPPILIFKFVGSSCESLREESEFTKYAEDFGASLRFEARAVIVKNGGNYTTFVKRNRLTE